MCVETFQVDFSVTECKLVIPSNQYFPDALVGRRASPRYHMKLVAVKYVMEKNLRGKTYKIFITNFDNKQKNSEAILRVDQARLLLATTSSCEHTFREKIIQLN